VTVREVPDPQGHVWRVWETDPDFALTPEFAGGALHMAYDGDRRILIPVPDRWTELSDDALLRLIHAAPRVPAAPWEHEPGDGLGRPTRGAPVRRSAPPKPPLRS
jgi:hypothetical protein